MGPTTAEAHERIPLLDMSAFERDLVKTQDGLGLFRSALRDARSALRHRFQAGESAERLVPAHCDFVDELLRHAWRSREPSPLQAAALVAVGGYGRGELHPASDIDILIIRAAPAEPSLDERIRRFITFLWDIGLEVGNSVRTIEECVGEARRDITIATSLMEARLLAGTPELFEQMRAATDRRQIWPSRDFFEAKWTEQGRRHHKFHDTAHNLEPNIKEGPGGLRDIQMVGWVAKRHFGADTLHELVTHEFLTESEFQTLSEGQSYLWQIRFALHLQAGRREDRLLFDYQRELAHQFGYRDVDHARAVEQFMKPYYRTIMELSRLNEMLLALFQEAILYADSPANVEPINERFQAQNRFLEVTHEDVFKDSPWALLELFLILQQRPDLNGVRASTIRLVRDHRYLIDERFRNDEQSCALFLDIIRQPRGITHELRRMHRYGVLGAYLPVFGAIEGQMQYDLFHAYTVDQHTLFVVGNLRGFAVEEKSRKFPLCSEISRRLPKPELLYLAGFFHDIAKGRGGDHSELGERDAWDFCMRHGISQYDARIVSWLVSNHLIMSVTAQRRDITDPEVVNQFAAQVGNQLHLDYLYLLTVADIRGTNPNLWNDWKDKLLGDLYESTQYALARGLENPIAKAELIEETLEEARRLLAAEGLQPSDIDAIWTQLGENYFLRTDPDEIVWHTQAVLATSDDALPLVLLRQGRGGTELFVYTHDQDCLFAAIASSLDRLGLTIHDARIITARNGMALDSFVVLEANGTTISGAEREAHIREELQAQLRNPTAAVRRSRRRAGRQLRHFAIPTRVRFNPDRSNDRTMMEVITADRPGLLSRLGWALVDCAVSLQNAKIATFGERAEDMFYVTDRNKDPLSPQACKRLRQRVIEVLEEERGTK